MDETTSPLPRPHRHLGVYGVCLRDEQILLIRKVRGPYTGLFDLPGGGIEFGEHLEAALRREFLEETGLALANISLRQALSNRVHYRADDGLEEDLHHLGLLYDVTLGDGTRGIPDPRSTPDGEDSGGAFWVAISHLKPGILTPFAQRALFGGATISKETETR